MLRRYRTNSPAASVSASRSRGSPCSARIAAARRAHELADATIQRQVLTLLTDLQQRLHMSYLFISHDLAVIRAVAHRIIVMKDGRIVERRHRDRARRACTRVRQLLAGIAVGETCSTFAAEAPGVTNAQRLRAGAGVSVLMASPSIRVLS
jgi:ABC-type sugar transport system ATPase subunit